MDSQSWFWIRITIYIYIYIYISWADQLSTEIRNK